MKIGIYDPYLDTLGGGERYILSIASFLQSDHSVDIFWDDLSILEEAKKRLSLDLGNISQKENIFTKKISTLQRIQITKNYDYFFYISDGSMPFLGAKNVIPIVQYPILDLKLGALSWLKLRNTKFILCYSEFVQKYLREIYRLPIKVLYPPVLGVDKKVKKENIILSVGRFTQGKNTKKQRFMIEFFNKNKMQFKNWRLVLAGSVLTEDENFLRELKEIKGPDIDIFSNLNRMDLETLYARSRIYWHAAGYGEDLARKPELAEHFGISVVEAMSAGSVPVVYDAGGLREIVKSPADGFLWSDESSLLQKTKLLLEDNRLREEISVNARKRAIDFSPEYFYKELNKLISV